MTPSERLAWQRMHDEDRRSMQFLGGAVLALIFTTLALLLI
jgi:hypothetical protein